MPRYALIGQSSKAKSVVVDSMRLVNGYAEAVESKQGKTAVAVYGTPGLTLFATCDGAGGMRSLYKAFGGRVFAVRGGGFFEVRIDGTTQLLGTLLTSDGPAVMTDNTEWLMLVDGNYGYTFNLTTNVFAQLTDPGFLGANTVTSLDNYFICNRPGTGQFYLSNLAVPVFSGLDFASAEGSPDPLLTVIAAHRELWLGGTETVEVWVNTGGTFPFSRVQGAFIEYGVAGPASMTRLQNTIYWLSGSAQGDPMAFMARGYQPERISTHSEEYAWRGYPTVADVIVWGEEYSGHELCWLTFPTAGHTWVYDGRNGLWHERSYRDPVTGVEGRHLANCFCVAFGLHHLVGDYRNGNIYAMHPDIATDNGDPQVLELILPPIADNEDLNRVAHYELTLDVETGVGLDGTFMHPAWQPQVMLQVSNDGGQTWGNEHWRSLGAIGQRKTRVGWHRLGMARDRRYRLRVSAPAKKTILGATIQVGATTS